MAVSTGADLRIQDDGNVVIYQKGNAVWSTGTGSRTRPRDYKPPPPPSEWKEHWHEHIQLLKLVRHDDDVALYFDRDMPHEDARWLLPLTTRIWQYTKKTYGDFGTPDDRLFAIFHQGRYGGGHPASYFDSSHDDRNVCDVGLKRWARSDDGYIIHEVSHIVEGASNGVDGLSGVRGHLGRQQVGGVFPVRSPRRARAAQGGRVGIPALQRTSLTISPGREPIGSATSSIRSGVTRGHAQVMVNFFRLLAKHYPKGRVRGRQGAHVFARRHQLGRIHPLPEWSRRNGPQAARDAGLRVAAGMGSAVPEGSRRIPRGTLPQVGPAGDCPNRCDEA